MKFSIQSRDTAKKPYDCLLVAVFEKGELTPAAKKIDKENQGCITQFIKQGDLEGKAGYVQTLYHLPHCERLLLVGCGKNKKLTERDFCKAIASSVRALKTSKATHALSYLTELEVDGRDLEWKLRQSILASSDALYQFDQYKSTKEPSISLKEISFFLSDTHDEKHYQKILKQSIAIADGVTFTKNIANQPSNICTPTYLAEEAKKFAKQFKNIKVTVLEEKDMKKLGMGAFLAVAKGSDQDAKLICLEYKGSAHKIAPVALVGKGITFDTGGISLKPAESMVGMKYDMCGAATVLGTIKAAAELKLPVNLVGIIAATENMPSGKASKPEDIVTSLSGQTIEILNTDAEGRLVLCDALTYCERYKPRAVIDIATLTGAVVIALGVHATGLLSNNEALTKELLAAGNDSFDRAWQLPLWDEYQEQIKSPFADMANTGGRMAGTITAGCFLSRFAKKFPWAHLDVAGTAAMMMGGSERYATGRPVPMLVQYLINSIEHSS